jgi:hypothetical protein
MNKQESAPNSFNTNLPLININAAGIDIGADRHWVSDTDTPLKRPFLIRISSDKFFSFKIDRSTDRLRITEQGKRYLVGEGAIIDDSQREPAT